MSWGRVRSCRGWGRTRLALPDAQQAGARASTGLSQGVELDAGGGGVRVESLGHTDTSSSSWPPPLLLSGSTLLKERPPL